MKNNYKNLFFKKKILDVTRYKKYIPIWPFRCHDE